MLFTSHCSDPSGLFNFKKEQTCLHIMSNSREHDPFCIVRVIALSKLVQLMCRYKLRSAVDIADVSDEYSVWARFGNELEKAGMFSDVSPPLLLPT